MTFRCSTKRMENICLYQDLYTNVHRRFIFIVKTWKQLKCSSTSDWIFKKLGGILQRNKRECTIDTKNNLMTKNNLVEWKKPEKKSKYWLLQFIWNSKAANNKISKKNANYFIVILCLSLFPWGRWERVTRDDYHATWGNFGHWRICSLSWL